MRIIAAITLILIFLPLPVFADLITTQSMIVFGAPYLLLLIIIAETLALWLITKYFKKKNIGLGRCLLAMSIANIVTALVGKMIPLGKGQAMAFVLLIVSYPLSSIIEAPLIKLLIRKNTYSMKDIIIMSFFVNLVTYLPMAIWLYFA